MTERPILFSAPMVRAILEGRKTQTRRIVKSWYEDKDDDNWPMFADEYGQWHRERCSYGQVGDRLWVREAFTECPTGNFIYREQETLTYGKPTADHNNKWTPSIHMPRRASRIDIEITGISVERLQDISEADAMAEGANPMLVPPDGGSCPHIEGFRDLWESIYGAGSWDVNPWVWVIEFKRVKP